jgi:hypothetical protein
MDYYQNYGSIRDWHRTGALDVNEGWFANCCGRAASIDDPEVVTRLQNEALLKARLALKDQKVNLGVAFAEANKTARLLGDTALSLLGALKDLKSGNVLGVQRHLKLRRKPDLRGYKNLPAKWLELQYGWKPLLSEVYGSAEALAQRHMHDWLVTGKGYAEERVDNTYVNDDLRAAGVYTAEGMRGCFVRIDALPDNDLLMAFRSMGITNPLSVAWNVAPLSFLLDWILPIGDYLDSLDAMLGMSLRGVSRSTLTKLHYRGTGSDSRNVWGQHTTASWTGMQTYTSLRRESLPSVPIPAAPQFKDPRSYGHAANALGLLGAFLAGYSNKTTRL